MLRAQMWYHGFYGGTVMAVELEKLYHEIYPKYDVKLVTKSCFGKKIEWFHTIETTEFLPLLNGNELVFSSGINYDREEWLWEMIDGLNERGAGGFLISLRDEKMFSDEIIAHCNEIEFPLFHASWYTPYIDIIRIFSEILLENEKRGTNLITALKNAILYPENKKLYMACFEQNGILANPCYSIAIVSCSNREEKEVLQKERKSLQNLVEASIVYEENGELVVFMTESSKKQYEDYFKKMCEKDTDIRVGIGKSVQRIQDIWKAWETALATRRLSYTVFQKNILKYEELGIYQVLVNTRDKRILMEYMQDTLGPLLEFDQDKQGEYLKILNTFFENECSILHTANALYCHKNTMNYKISKIKEVMGCDITQNENRMKIMLALAIMNM